MNPIFTVPYSELRVAEMIMCKLKKSDGCSVYIPMSRQEEGVDLLIYKNNNYPRENIALSIQVKSSRTYLGTPAIREKTKKRYKYYTWFNTFKVNEKADYYILYGVYPSEENMTAKKTIGRWLDLALIFNRVEMSEFIDNVKTKKGTRDGMFSFGFDTPEKIIQVRGNHVTPLPDYSSHLFNSRITNLLSDLHLTMG